MKKYLIVKRCLDVVFAFLLFWILSPLMLLIAVAIRLDSKGPILFVQQRSGKNNKKFHLYKFRSMSVNNDVRDLTEGDQLTKVGSFIRKTSLDELPNIINILKGEMSFIGPRPWIPEYAEYFTNRQKKRLNVLPGITGLAQVSGRNNLNIYDKIDTDIEYVENCSFLLDVKIIFMTIISLFKKVGVENDKYGIRNELDELKLQHMHVHETRVERRKRREQQKELVEV